MEDREKLLTIQKASSMIGVNAGTLRRWAQENKVKAYKIGTRGDWRFREKNLQEIIMKNDNDESNADDKYVLTNKFLLSRADSIQKLATQLHKKFLGAKRFRTEYINKYQKNHIKIVQEIANNLKIGDVKRGSAFFRKFGENFGREAIKDGLTIEETVDGIIFLKQAVWQKLKEKKLLEKFTAIEMFDVNQVIGTYCDVVASKIAFTYHEYYRLKSEMERDRLYNLFMQAPVPVAIVKGPAHIYELSNPLNDFGLGKKITIGKSVKEHFPGTEQNGVIALLDQVYKTGKPYIGKEQPFVVNIPGRGKETKYINFTYQPLRGIDNKVEGVMVVANDVSEQVISRHKIQESEERLRTLTEAIPQIVYVADANGNPEYFNKQWYEYTGLNAHRNVTGESSRLIHKEDTANVFEKWKKAQKTSNIFEAEYRLKAKDGSYRWFIGRSVPVKDGKGKVINWFGTATDIEAAKQAEREAAFERRKLHDLFMQAPAMIAVSKGPDLVFELANPLYLKVVGKTEKILGKSVLEVFPEIKGQPIMDILRNVYKTGEPFIGKEIMIKLDTDNDGKTEDVYFNFVYQAFKDEKGKVAGIMTHAVEITDMVAARKKVEEAEEKFRMLADNIPNLAWMANPDGYITWYNSRWYEFTGTTPKQMKGWGWQSVHEPDTLPKVLHQWNKSIKNGTVFEMVFPLKGADGEYRTFLTRVVPIRDEKGKIIRWFGSNTDITKQKELERQKDDFLGIASHELKTPVTSIKAYGQVLERIFQKRGDSASVELLSKMGTQVDRLTSLIEDLLDVTKIQSGRLKFNDNYFDFNVLVEEIVEELQRTTDRHKIITELSMPKKIHGDRDRTGQVISNLISNAIKYSPKSDKIIIKSQQDGTNVTLSVQDYGIGIPKEKQSRVFEQFFRVSGDREITFPGLGLGLYVSSEIVKREGGRIWVNSIKGKGSTFCFSLPISKKSKK